MPGTHSREFTLRIFVQKKMVLFKRKCRRILFVSKIHFYFTRSFTRRQQKAELLLLDEGFRERGMS